jgi:RNA polymerase sigma factor (sigma-70 family)
MCISLGTMNLKLQRRSQRRRKESAPCLAGLRKLSSEAKPLLAGEEREIVQRALTGDSEALSTLFARASNGLYRTAFAVLRNKQDSEDALQNGLLSAYLNLGSFKGRSKLSTWLTRIVLNAALMNQRERRALPQVSIDEMVVGNPQLWDLRLFYRRGGTRGERQDQCDEVEGLPGALSAGESARSVRRQFIAHPNLDDHRIFSC